MNTGVVRDQYWFATNLSEGQRPADNFVICRGVDGVPTAVYGEQSWDLNPIRLRANFENLINFDSFRSIFTSLVVDTHTPHSIKSEIIFQNRLLF